LGQEFNGEDLSRYPCVRTSDGLGRNNAGGQHNIPLDHNTTADTVVVPMFVRDRLDLAVLAATDG
jgi:hypothetical protein